MPSTRHPVRPKPPLFDGSQKSNDLRQQLLDDSHTTFFSKDRFFTELTAMFKYAEKKQHSWEHYLYRPWGYLLSSFCHTFFRPDMSLTCGAQHPFMNRTTKEGTKTLEYCLPDFALVLSALDDSGNVPDHIFLIVEIKPLPDVQWDTQEGRHAATVTLTGTVNQATRQARLAFKRHPELRYVSVLVACAVWWTVYEFDREDMFPKPAETSPDSPPSVDDPSPQPGQKRRGWSDSSRLRSSKDKQPAKKLKVGSPSRDPATESSPTDSSSPVSSESEGSAYAPSDRDEGSLSDNAAQSPDPIASEVMTVDHVMQLGSETPELNPWLRSFFRHCVAMAPTVNHDEFQKSWFDLVSWERGVYRWDHHEPSDDLGFEDGFVLPGATAAPLPEFDLEEITNFVRVDEPPLVDNRGKTDLSAMLSPGLKLPDVVRTPGNSVRPVAWSRALALTAILNNAQTTEVDRPGTPLGDISSDGGRSKLHGDVPGHRAAARLPDVDEDSGEVSLPGLGEESPTARATARARLNPRAFSHAVASISRIPASSAGFPAFIPNNAHGTAVAHNPQPIPRDSSQRFTAGGSRPIFARSSRGARGASSTPRPRRGRSTTAHSNRSLLGVGGPSRATREFERHLSNPFLVDSDNPDTGQQGSGLFTDVARGRSSERSRSHSVPRGGRSQTVDSPGRHRRASVDGGLDLNDASGNQAPTHRRRSSSFSGLGSGSKIVPVTDPHRTPDSDSEVMLNLDIQGMFGNTGDLHLPSFASPGPEEAGPSNNDLDQGNDKHASSKGSTNESSKHNERDRKGKGAAS